MNDQEAKKIAHMWHSGRATNMFSFAASGVIFNNLINEIYGAIDTAEGYNENERVMELKDLLKYVKARKNKDPIVGWDKL